MGKYGDLAKNAIPDPGKMKFAFIKGKYSGGEFFIRDGQKLSIGRDISSDVAIVDSKVSRHHASITSKDGKFFIEDHNSSNGTFINKKKMASSVLTEIFIGTEVTIGDSIIVVGGIKHEKPSLEIPAKEENQIEEIEIGENERKIEIIAPEKVVTEYVDEELMSLDVLVQKISNENKISIAKVALTKGIPAAKTTPDSFVGPAKGSFSAIDPCDLLKSLCQSSSTGSLIAKTTSPFEEELEITIGATGIVAAKSISKSNFSQEKTLSRLLLALGGDYEFKIDETFRREKINSFLEDIFNEISNQRGVLSRYRKVIKTNHLKFLIPIRGKLSDLSKTELESLQFMVNTREVLEYLNLFPENDDFILLSEFIKFVDMGILLGDSKDAGLVDSVVPDDLVEM